MAAPSQPRVKRRSRRHLAACAGMLALALAWPRGARAEPEPPVGGGPLAEPVLLRMVAKDPGFGVERLLPDGTRRALCAAPCDYRADKRDIFVVTEDGAPKSPAFSLADTDREVTLTVRRGSRGMAITGGALLALGGVTQLVSFMLVGGDPAPEEIMSKAGRPYEGTILVVGLGGIVVAGVGVYLLWRSAGRVDSSTGRSFHLTD